MEKSATRIRTSHVGRLPPPKGWEDMPARLANAEMTDGGEMASRVVPAIAETVRKQVEIGIDCINDGEFWTARSLAHYAATTPQARPAGQPPTTPPLHAPARRLLATSMRTWTSSGRCFSCPAKSRCRR